MLKDLERSWNFSGNCLKKNRIIGIGVCGKGEASRYLEKTLKEFKRLCDDVIIATNYADKKTKMLIKKYGFWQYEDNREWGTNQPHIKTNLLKKAGNLSPDWIIALDMDEAFAPEFTRQEAERLAQIDEIAWYFMIVNLYGDEEHFAHDIGIQRFWNIRFYKFLPEYGLEFQRKNLHCGLAPPIAYQYGWHAPFYVKHYGLMKLEDRLSKADRYDKYDPNAKYKGKEYYEDLRRELKAHRFDPQKLLEQLRNSVDCQLRVRPRLS